VAMWVETGKGLGHPKTLGWSCEAVAALGFVMEIDTW
jgi:hypothetical protein